MSAEKLKCVLSPQNILFVAEVTCIFIIVCVSLLNLTLEKGDQHLWTMFLTSSLAFLMPSPKFKMVENTDAVSDKDVKASSQTVSLEEGKVKISKNG